MLRSLGVQIGRICVERLWSTGMLVDFGGTG